MYGIGIPEHAMNSTRSVRFLQASRKFADTAGTTQCAAHFTGLFFAVLFPFYPPSEHANSTPSIRALRPVAAACLRAPVGDAAAPVAMRNALHGRWASRRSLVFPQQARASVPWVTP